MKHFFNFHNRQGQNLVKQKESGQPAFRYIIQNIDMPKFFALYHLSYPRQDQRCTNLESEQSTVKELTSKVDSLTMSPPVSSQLGSETHHHLVSARKQFEEKYLSHTIPYSK